MLVFLFIGFCFCLNLTDYVKVVLKDDAKVPTCLTFSNYQKTSHFSLYSTYCDQLPTLFRINSGGLLCTMKYSVPKVAYIPADGTCIKINDDLSIVGSIYSESLFGNGDYLFKSVNVNGGTQIVNVKYNKCIGVNKKTKNVVLLSCDTSIEPYYNLFV